MHLLHSPDWGLKVVASHLFDESEVRRVTNVMVNKYSSSKTSSLTLTTFVAILDADDGDDREDVNYTINAELHRCIREAIDIMDKSCNSGVHFVSD